MCLNHVLEQQCWQQGPDCFLGIEGWRSTEWCMAVSTEGLQTFWETTVLQERNCTYLRFAFLWQLRSKTLPGWNISIHLTTGEKLHPPLFPSQVQGRQGGSCSHTGSSQALVIVELGYSLVPWPQADAGAFHGLSLSSSSQLVSWVSECSWLCVVLSGAGISSPAMFAASAICSPKENLYILHLKYVIPETKPSSIFLHKDKVLVDLKVRCIYVH